MEPNYKICHICGEKMLPQITSETFQSGGKSVEVKEVEMFVCSKCGEKALKAETLKEIEKQVRAGIDRLSHD